MFSIGKKRFPSLRDPFFRQCVSFRGNFVMNILRRLMFSVEEIFLSPKGTFPIFCEMLKSIRFL